MRRCGLDVLVATSPVNITYLTDYYCWMSPLLREHMVSPGGGPGLAQAYAVLPVEGEPALVVRPNFSANASQIWVHDVRLGGKPRHDRSQEANLASEEDRRLWKLLCETEHADSANDALLRCLSDRGLTDARIGLEFEGLTDANRAFLTGALPQTQIKDCSNLFRIIRMVKSEEEIRRLTRSAEINERAGMESLAQARPGRPISDLIELYRVRVAEAGAVFDHFAFSIHGFGIATEPPHTLADDELAFIDFGCVADHHFSDTGTTLALGAAQRVAEEKYGVLRKMMDAGMKTIRPGAKASEVHAAMAEVLDAHDLASHPIGHGLGLDVREYPIIVPDNGLRIRDDCVDESSDLALEAGMVFNLEAPLFMPGFGALQIEQTIIVTGDGCRPLIEQDRGAPVMPERKS